jgi:hypothetical protein
VGPIGEIGGSSVGKGGESDVASPDFHGSNPHPCRLRTDGLAPASKY